MIPDTQTLSSLNYKNPNGTVSVEVSYISADKAILTVKAVSYTHLFPGPVTGRPRRPLSIRASTAS